MKCSFNSVNGKHTNSIICYIDIEREKFSLPPQDSWLFGWDIRFEKLFIERNYDRINCRGFGWLAY